VHAAIILLEMVHALEMRQLAFGYWPLAGENIGDFIDAGDLVRSRRFFSPFLAPQARAQRSGARNRLKPAQIV